MKNSRGRVGRAESDRLGRLDAGKAGHDRVARREHRPLVFGTNGVSAPNSREIMMKGENGAEPDGDTPVRWRMQGRRRGGFGLRIAAERGGRLTEWGALARERTGSRFFSLDTKAAGRKSRCLVFSSPGRKERFNDPGDSGRGTSVWAAEAAPFG